MKRCDVCGNIRLVVLRVLSPEEAEIAYDGPGTPAWVGASNVGKNGQQLGSQGELVASGLLETSIGHKFGRNRRRSRGCRQKDINGLD